MHLLEQAASLLKQKKSVEATKFQFSSETACVSKPSRQSIHSCPKILVQIHTGNLHNLR